VEAFADEYENKIGFFDLPAGPNRELLIELGVSGLPTFLFFKNGQELSYLAGRNILMEEIVEHTARLIEA
jgi:thioredoxin 1